MDRGNGNSDNNSNSKWLLNNILSFLQAQKERVERGATIHNFVKAIKLFCEMNDISISCKKSTRGLPKGRNSINKICSKSLTMLFLVDIASKISTDIISIGEAILAISVMDMLDVKTKQTNYCCYCGSWSLLLLLKYVNENLFIQRLF